MENPFAKLVSEGGEPSMEDMEVVDIVTETEDGIVYWWKKFKDGSEDFDNKKRLMTEADDTEGVMEELDQIKNQLGLNEGIVEV